jgi:hypothetical protein
MRVVDAEHVFGRRFWRTEIAVWVDHTGI